MGPLLEAALGGCGISNLETVRNPCGTVCWGRFRTLSSNFSAPFPGSASGSASGSVSGSPSGSRSLGTAPRADPEGTQKRLQGALLEAAQAFSVPKLVSMYDERPPVGGREVLFVFFRARRAEQKKGRKCAGGTGGEGELQDGGWNEGSAGESERLGSEGARKVRGKDGKVLSRKKCRTRGKNGGKGGAGGKKRRKISGNGGRREYKWKKESWENRERGRREKGTKQDPWEGRNSFLSCFFRSRLCFQYFVSFFFLRRMEGRKSRGVGAGAERGVENGRVKGWKGVEERKQKDKRRHFSITCPAHKNEIRKYQFW